jgi:hypothetical protein
MCSYLVAQFFLKLIFSLKITSTRIVMGGALGFGFRHSFWCLRRVCAMAGTQ